MPGLCVVCGRAYCDHTSEERGLTPEQSDEEFNRDFTSEERAAYERGDTKAGIRAARIACSRLYGKVYSLPDGDVVGL